MKLHEARYHVDPPIIGQIRRCAETGDEECELHPEGSPEKNIDLFTRIFGPPFAKREEDERHFAGMKWHVTDKWDILYIYGKGYQNHLRNAVYLTPKGTGI